MGATKEDLAEDCQEAVTQKPKTERWANHWEGALDVAESRGGAMKNGHWNGHWNMNKLMIHSYELI